MVGAMKKIIKDVAVIGAGPSGLFAVFECGFLGYSSVVIDALPQIGGQLAELYPEKPIYDIPGYPEILAGELVNNLAKQIEPYAPEYVLGQGVNNLEETADGFVLTTPEAQITAKTIIIAGGGGMFSPRKPKLENLAAFEEKSVFYAVRQKADFAGKHVAIAGGGDSAVDWAVELAQNAAHVHVIHRRDDFRAAEETVRQMRDLAAAGKITLHTSSQLGALAGEGGQLSHITLKNNDGSNTDIKADSLLCFFGLLPTLGSVADFGLELTGKRIAVEPTTMKTNRNGIFAVGDMAAYEGKISLILVGFAEATMAAKSVQAHINPEKKFKVVYSTSHKPGE